MDLLVVNNLSKKFKSGDKEILVLENIHFSLPSRDSLAIVGPSGSGKTTLLGLCAGLDDPSSGNVFIAGNNINLLSEDEKAKMRNTMVGFIFQNFQLLPSLTALENVLVPLELQRKKNVKERGRDLLAKVGLQDRMNHYPSQLSGGEQQRVALARAFSNTPSILFADEPTGNLDFETGEMVIDLLFQLNAESGTTLVIVTHDLDLAKKTNKILYLKSGKKEPRSNL